MADARNVDPATAIPVVLYCKKHGIAVVLSEPEVELASCYRTRDLDDEREILPSQPFDSGGW
jgi:hypothetical protein